MTRISTPDELTPGQFTLIKVDPFTGVPVDGFGNWLRADEIRFLIFECEADARAFGEKQLVEDPLHEWMLYDSAGVTAEIYNDLKTLEEAAGQRKRDGSLFQRLRAAAESLLSKRTRHYREGCMYQIELDGEVIGATRLEMGDPPMGVVYGKIVFYALESPYAFLKNYCESLQIPINEEDEELEFIDIQNMEGLKVYRGDGVEIAGVPGAAVTGMREEGYMITILGVPYPFYAEEFPRHCESYRKRFGGGDAG